MFLPVMPSYSNMQRDGNSVTHLTIQSQMKEAVTRKPLNSRGFSCSTRSESHCNNNNPKFPQYRYSLAHRTMNIV